MDRASSRLGDIGSSRGCFQPIPAVTGRPDVFVNALLANRISDDAAPHGFPNCSPHLRAVAEGTSTVWINGKPATRISDGLDCGGKLSTGSSNGLIGGLARKYQLTLERGKR